MTITYLGTGLIGSGLVEAALKRAEDVVVWNRSPEKTARLAELGARVAPDPASAVRGAERVHLALSEDAAVDEVLEAIVPALDPGVLVIDHTTASPRGTAARAVRCDERGIEFLHAPVFMGPGNARDATGLMLCAGPQARFARAEPALVKMTGRVWYVGERADLAAAHKLFGNAMILVLTEACADVYRMAASLDIAPIDAHTLFTHFKPGGVLEMRGARMARGDYDPSFALTMARKDARLMIEAADPRALVLLAPIAAHMDRLIAQGQGERDLGVLSVDVIPPRQP